MSIAIDFGSREFRSLRCMNGRLIRRTCRPEYAILPDTPRHRKLLAQSKTPMAFCGGKILLYGSGVEEWSDVLKSPLIPILKDGSLPEGDVVARQILSILVDGILPQAQVRGEVCCASTPCGSGALRNEITPEINFFQQLISLKGYQPLVVKAGLAVVLAELGREGFSGIGMSFGATSCDFSVAQNGRELFGHTIHRGFADIVEDLDLSAAERSAATYKLLESIMVDSGRKIFRQMQHAGPKGSISFACAGGITQSESFPAMLEKALQAAGWKTRGVIARIADDTTSAIARGCLIHAELEQMQKAAA